MRTAVSNLKPGMRFSFIPPAWHGPGRITESSASGGTVWKIEWAESKVVNPPGVWYGEPSTVVRVLPELKSKKAGRRLDRSRR